MESGGLILIAIVNNRRDLNIARTKHWYRIPAENAPNKLKQMDYIGFYQTGAFGVEKWSVSYWSEIRGIKLVKRYELLPGEKDHPRANEEYYKVEIGELKRLPKPLTSSKGRRIVYKSSSLEQFRSARSVDDLFKNPESKRARELSGNQM